MDRTVLPLYTHRHTLFLAVSHTHTHTYRTPSLVFLLLELPFLHVNTRIRTQYLSLLLTAGPEEAVVAYGRAGLQHRSAQPAKLNKNCLPLRIDGSAFLSSLFLPLPPYFSPRSIQSSVLFWPASVAHNEAPSSETDVSQACRFIIFSFLNLYKKSIDLNPCKLQKSLWVLESIAHAIYMRLIQLIPAPVESTGPEQNRRTWNVRTQIHWIVMGAESAEAAKQTSWL